MAGKGPTPRVTAGGPWTRQADTNWTEANPGRRPRNRTNRQGYALLRPRGDSKRHLGHGKSHTADVWGKIWASALAMWATSDKRSEESHAQGGPADCSGEVRLREDTQTEVAGHSDWQKAGERLDAIESRKL